MEQIDLFNNLSLQDGQKLVDTYKKSGWKKPNLNNSPKFWEADFVAIDTETYDPELLQYGPGWGRGKGYIVGVSFAAYINGKLEKLYIPTNHKVREIDNVLGASSYIKRVLQSKNTKVFANATYDIGWLQETYCKVNGYKIDVLVIEALLEERGLVNLDSMAKKYLGVGKETVELYQWCAQAYGGKPDSSQRKNIWRSPPELVAPYAESDAELPLRLYKGTYPILRERGLLKVFDLECRLIQPLVDMRMPGVTVDVDRAHEVSNKLFLKERDAQERMDNLAGFKVNPSATASIKKAFKALDIPIQKVYDKSIDSYKESFDKRVISKIKHPFIEQLLLSKTYKNTRTTFVNNSIIDGNVNGKLYTTFNGIRNEFGGTKSGRLSSSKPNLQNVPSRDKEMRNAVRGLFVPDDGHVQWRCYDLSQIEYRMLAEVAVGDGSKELKQSYINKPKLDYHDKAINLVKNATGLILPRKPAKNFNFGSIYGMGFESTKDSLGLDDVTGKRLYDAYHAGAPYARQTLAYFKQLAERDGYVTTVLGRRAYFDLWLPRNYYATPLPINEAVEAYGDDIQLYKSYSALNRVCQGSAADQLKMSIVKCYEDGIFDVTGMPRLTVHDELDFSDPGGLGTSDAFDEMQHVMETSIPELTIPIICDYECGPDWGHLK